MTIYAIGDVQGCWDQVTQLLAILPDGNQAELIFVGDLVNRGPKSLETLRGIRALSGRARVVLGNHDLHLLAVALGIRAMHRNDTLAPILDAPDRECLLDWLRAQPLAMMVEEHLIVHAGLLPQWSIAQALALSTEVSNCLRGPEWMSFLQHMYGNTPTAWRDDLVGFDRLRCIVNAMTRLRFCTDSGVMDFSSTESATRPPEGCLPWFDVPGRASAQGKIVVGHWSTLGLIVRPDLVAIDTGCVWGGKLTAVRLHDRAVFQVDCPQQQQPGPRAAN